MKKRSFHIFIRCTVLWSFTLLLLSACNGFHGDFFDRYLLSSEASSNFIRSIRPYRGDVESHYSLACYFQQRKKHNLALEEFRTAVDIDPTYVKAFNGMGVSYDSLGDYARAIESYKAALQVNRNLDYVLNNLGYAYFLQGNLDQAIESFKKAIALNQNNARYHNNLGLAYGEKEQYDLALSEFKLAGDDAVAHHNIGKIFYRKGLYDDAAIQFSRVSAMNPTCVNEDRYLNAADALGGIFAEPDKNRETEIDAKKTAASLKESVEFSTSVAPTRHADTFGSNEIRQLETKTILEAGVEQDLKPLSKRVVVEVSNGNGVNRMARNVGTYLNSEDFQFMYLSNADHFNYPQTTIYYISGHLQAARKAAQKLPGRQKMVMVPCLGKGGHAAIKVLIGKDLIPHLSLFKRT